MTTLATSRSRTCHPGAAAELLVFPQRNDRVLDGERAGVEERLFMGRHIRGVATDAPP